MCKPSCGPTALFFANGFAANGSSSATIKPARHASRQTNEGQMNKTAALLLLAMTAGSSAQTVYRCTDATGKVELSDKACGKDAADGSRVRLRPNTLDTSEARELRLREENARLRDQLQQRQDGMRVNGRTEADLQAERSQSYECRQAQRNYEVAASSITARNGASRRSAEQQMRVACGMREPTQVNVYNETTRVVRTPLPAANPPPDPPKPFLPGNYNPAAGGFTDTEGNYCGRVAGGLRCPNGFVPVQ